MTCHRGKQVAPSVLISDDSWFLHGKDILQKSVLTKSDCQCLGFGIVNLFQPVCFDSAALTSKGKNVSHRMWKGLFWPVFDVTISQLKVKSAGMFWAKTGCISKSTWVNYCGLQWQTWTPCLPFCVMFGCLVNVIIIIRMITKWMQQGLMLYVFVLYFWSVLYLTPFSD